MLVLSRKPGESVVIGGQVRVTLLDIRPGHVRLGIVAPQDVLVDREEISNKRREGLAGRPDLDHGAAWIDDVANLWKGPPHVK